MEKKMQVQFAPGCFDDFEGTQEELDALIEEIKKLVESGEIFEQAEPVSDEDTAQIYEHLKNRGNRQ